MASSYGHSPLNIVIVCACQSLCQLSLSAAIVGSVVSIAVQNRYNTYDYGGEKVWLETNF